MGLSPTGKRRLCTAHANNGRPDKEANAPLLENLSSLWNVDEVGLLLTSLPDRNLNAVEIGWPFRLGFEGCIVDRNPDIGWQRTFGHGRKIVPEMLQ